VICRRDRVSYLCNIDEVLVVVEVQDNLLAPFQISNCYSERSVEISAYVLRDIPSRGRKRRRRRWRSRKVDVTMTMSRGFTSLRSEDVEKASNLAIVSELELHA
jgi:hypothetical protein